MLLSEATNGVYKFIAFSAQMVYTHTWNGKCSDYDNQWNELKNSLHIFYVFKSEWAPHTCLCSGHCVQVVFFSVNESIALFRVLVFSGIVENFNLLCV